MRGARARLGESLLAQSARGSACNASQCACCVTRGQCCGPGCGPLRSRHERQIGCGHVRAPPPMREDGLGEGPAGYVAVAQVRGQVTGAAGSPPNTRRRFGAGTRVASSRRTAGVSVLPGARPCAWEPGCSPSPSISSDLPLSRGRAGHLHWVGKNTCERISINAAHGLLPFVSMGRGCHPKWV
ncbi:hypothetical protein NDU88_004878 [Pleurodeles waltl]|uniref:Uncharacterized protein n=1 Tax=Pleurodeles waltl TaxID=8319 RepID=A0AAV7KZL4_PLEWA|nr:hypothetical protein NDU88_004878 [Pleurodeles waltl]